MRTKIFIILGGVFGILAVLICSSASRLMAAPPDHEFVGVKKCAMCHQKPEQGAQFKIWQETKHAKAYETLGTPEAKQIAAKMGIDNPQTSGKCLKCHSTAYGFSETKVTEVIPVEEAISCESCHGAGKDYMKMSVMKDLNAAKDAGLIIPDEKTCQKCHNAENPFNKPFNYQERLEKIKHSVPKA